MSYRCEICTAAVPHGQPLRRHTVYRHSPVQIACEYAVCAECEKALRTEYLSDLLAAHRSGSERLPPIPARPCKPPQPAPAPVVTLPPPVTAAKVPSGLSNLYTPED